jgi:predicted Zn finger-like uncharacterized protein
MRFVCDSCRAQYMISDEKVGAKGVKVRCKKCGFVITVRKSEPANELAETQVMTTPTVDAPTSATPANAEKPASGDGLFSGVDEDEIGAVFDQVLGGAPSPAASGEPAAASEDEEFQSTRVVDAGTLKKLAGASAPDGEAETAKDDDKASAAQHEWYVAIDEKQSGPLTLEKIKDLWDRGEIGADNLCWRAGFSDWLPLSEVGELAAVVAPKPAKPVISSNAHVSPALNAVADSSDDSGPAGAEAESEWQPSAASALASLVKDEIETLTRPPPKKPESAPMAPISSLSAPASEQAPGLLDAPLPPDPFGDAPTVTRGQPLPAMPPGGDEPTYTGARPSSVPPSGPGPAPTFTPPPYAYSAPPAPSSKKPMMIALAAGGVLLVALMMVIVFLLGRGQQPAVAQAPTPIPVQHPVTPPTPPTQVAQAQPAPTQPAQTNPVVPASTTPSSGTPTPAVATTQPPKPAVEQPTQPAKTEVAQNDDSPKKHERHHRGSDTGSHEVIAKADPVEPRHESPPPNPPKKGGDDFDAIFGGGGDSSGSSQPAASASNSGGSKKHSSVYVPPAPGGADVPDTLEQSDIMKVVLDNKPAIVKCVNEQKAQDPNLSGRLVVRWTILTSGHTSGVTVRSDEFKRTHMASCIAGLVKGWKFPRHKTQGEPIDFPFTF